MMKARTATSRSTRSSPSGKHATTPTKQASSLLQITSSHKKAQRRTQKAQKALVKGSRLIHRATHHQLICFVPFVFFFVPFVIYFFAICVLSGTRRKPSM